MRESFLTRQLDLSSLDALNRACFAWLEDDYHQRERSSLGMKPIDRFGLDGRGVFGASLTLKD